MEAVGRKARHTKGKKSLVSKGDKRWRHKGPGTPATQSAQPFLTYRNLLLQ